MALEELIVLVIGFVLFGIAIIFGNGLVLYAGYGRRNILRLAVMQNFDMIIKSLALTDLLIGLIGIPSRILRLTLPGNSLGNCQMRIKNYEKIQKSLDLYCLLITD